MEIVAAASGLIILPGEPVLAGTRDRKKAMRSISQAWHTGVENEPIHVIIRPVVPKEWDNRATKAFWICADGCQCCKLARGQPSFWDYRVSCSQRMLGFPMESFLPLVEQLFFRYLRFQERPFFQQFDVEVQPS